MRFEWPSIVDVNRFLDDAFSDGYLIIYGTVDVMLIMWSVGDTEPGALLLLGCFIKLGCFAKVDTKLALLVPLLDILTVAASFSGLTY